MKILIIEDEEAMAEALVEGLKRSTAYDFEVDVCVRIEEYVETGAHNAPYDMVVVDLALSDGQVAYAGLRLVADRAREFPGSLIVVYSAFPEIPNVVKAIRFGADNFVSKKEFPPDQFVTMIEGFLERSRRDRERQQEIERLTEDNYDAWQHDFAGQTIILVRDRVVAHGATRVYALLDYWRQLENHPDWPEFPDILDIL